MQDAELIAERWQRHVAFWYEYTQEMEHPLLRAEAQRRAAECYRNMWEALAWTIGVVI